ncbi:MAG: glycosyltransferase family 2 protein [Opitutales bacterium]
MIQITVLLAGQADSFKDAGYLYPKNLVEINERPLIQHILDNLSSITEADRRIILTIPTEEDEQFHTAKVAQLLEPEARVVPVKGSTAGAACTAMLAIEALDPDAELVITNGDILMDIDLQAAIDDFRRRDLDGGMIVFEGVHPRWSFVKLNDDGLAIETAEKRPISNLATTGFYYFRKASDFYEATSSMLRKDAHVNGLFFLCPVYNEMILRQKKIGIHRMPKEKYHTLKNPQDIRSYEELLHSRTA